MSESAAEQFNIHEAKTKLSRIIERVERGSGDRHQPGRQTGRQGGATADQGSPSWPWIDEGRLALAANWDAPMVNDEIARGFDPRP